MIMNCKKDESLLKKVADWVCIVGLVGSILIIPVSFVIRHRSIENGVVISDSGWIFNWASIFQTLIFIVFLVVLRQVLYVFGNISESLKEIAKALKKHQEDTNTLE
jgi:hypothetical protein